MYQLLNHSPTDGHLFSIFTSIGCPKEHSYTCICFIYSDTYFFFLPFPLRLLVLGYIHYKCLPAWCMYYYSVYGIIYIEQYIFNLQNLNFFDGNKCANQPLKKISLLSCLRWFTHPGLYAHILLYKQLLFDIYIFYPPRIYFPCTSSCGKQYNAFPHKMCVY